MPFLDRDTFGQVQQEALRLRLDEMKGYCLPQDTMKEMARILTQRDLLGCGDSVLPFMTFIFLHEMGFPT